MTKVGLLSTLLTINAKLIDLDKDLARVNKLLDAELKNQIKRGI